MSAATEATLETIETPDGPFTVIVDGDGAVIASGWTESEASLLRNVDISLQPETVRRAPTKAARAVLDYYSGDFEAVNHFPIKQVGTDFQRRGWEALRRIPPGKPLTYGEFAEEIGSPAAVRAAASICARNSVALFVPCHRVIRSDGSLGGFGWGVTVKDSLLRREDNDRLLDA